MIFVNSKMLKNIKSRVGEGKTFCQFGILCDFCTPFRKKKRRKKIKNATLPALTGTPLQEGRET